MSCEFKKSLQKSGFCGLFAKKPIDPIKSALFFLARQS